MSCPAGDLESSVGLRVFYTDTAGVGGKIKAIPDDFVVDEVSLHPPACDGRYTVAKITSRNWETNGLIKELSRRLRISRERVGFAGTKDKRAITSQLMSFPVTPDTLNQIRISDVAISDAYSTNKPLFTGDLIGNRFTIAIRDISLGEDELSVRAGEVVSSLNAIGGFPNFFGVQRFGVVRPNTHLVGKKIIEGDLEGAVRGYIGNPYPSEPTEIRNARENIDNAGDNFKEALRACHPMMSFERAMLNGLISSDGDWASALDSLPRNLLRMFVHAYQSYLFNLILSERMDAGLPFNEPVPGDIVFPSRGKNITESKNGIAVTLENLAKITKQVSHGRAFVTAPLFGKSCELAKGEMGEIERRIIEKEGVLASDFSISALPELSSLGLRRIILAPVKDLDYTTFTDDLNEGKMGLRLSFELLKGCYATCLLREFMKADMTNY